MTAPVLDTKQYIFTKNDVTVYLEINCRRKLYSVDVKDSCIENIFSSTDNFDFNITAAELIADAVTFAKDELNPNFTVD